MPDPTPGETAYTAWLTTMRHVMPTPWNLATWAEISAFRQAAWEAAAQAVQALTLRDLVDGQAQARAAREDRR